MNNKNMVRGALLIALALVLQSIRLVLPLPPLVSTFIIGSLVHMMLIITHHQSSKRTAMLLCCMLPMTAYMQGQLLLPILIPVVAIGNLLYLLLYSKLLESKLVYVLPPLAKAIIMVGTAYMALQIMGIHHPVVIKTILFGMSVPQLVTGIAGLLLAKIMLKRIQ